MRCVLVEMNATKDLGEPVYFESETTAAPYWLCTADWHRARKFESQQEAMDYKIAIGRCAYEFWLKDFLVFSAETETDVWEALTTPENTK